MRHGKKFNHLGRTAAHRAAMLSNMAASLIIHKRVATTVAKAKALRKYVEPLLTKSKSDTTHSRRTVFSYLQNKESVKELFDSVSAKIAARPGGYTRIIKTGTRLGDNAEMCLIELVDYNEDMLSNKGTDTAGKPKTRRRASGKKKEGAEASAVATDTASTEESEAPAADTSTKAAPAADEEATEQGETPVKE